MSKRARTKYLGIYERPSNIRKHLGKFDICYEITYRREDKKIWEKVGWASEGYNAKLASTIRAERIRSIRHNEELPQDKKKIPYFKDMAEKYLEWTKENKTREGYDEEIRYRIHLKPEFDDKRLDVISSFDLERLKAKLIKKGLAPATQKHILVVFREIFNKALAWDKSLNLQNPIKGIKLPNPKNNRLRFYTPEEIDLLLSALKPYKQLYDMALLSLRTGLRLKEMTGIKGQDLDFKNDIIHVLDPKNDEEGEVVYMTPDIKSILKSYDIPKHEYIFKDRNGNRIKEVSATFSRIVKKLGFNDNITDRRQILTFHNLRHTFASWLALNGEDLKTIQELMRHKTISMTMKYAHLIPSHKKQAVNRIALKQEN